MGTCQGRDNEGEPEREMYAVVVPNGGSMPFEVSNALMYGYTATRELALSRCILKCLGKDWTEREESLYYYEFAPGRSLADLLISGKNTKRGVGGCRVVLPENSLLFRYWSRELLMAMAELQQQSCHHLVNQCLDLRNIVVYGGGLKLRLAHLRWGPQISQFAQEGDQALLRRMKMLMRDYGGILQDVLGLTRNACWNGWYSNIGEVVAESELYHVPHHDAMAGIEVGQGDEVVVELDAHGRWYTSYQVVIAGDGVTTNNSTAAHGSRSDCVHVRWTDQESCKEIHRFRVCGKIIGKCRILCHYYELNDPRRTIQFVPLTVQVTPVAISARLKAILQCCQLATGALDDGVVKMRLGGKMREYLKGKSLGNIWLQDLMKNDYYAPFSPGDLEVVMEEYEALFGSFTQE